MKTKTHIHKEKEMTDTTKELTDAEVCNEVAHSVWEKTQAMMHEQDLRAHYTDQVPRADCSICLSMEPDTSELSSPAGLPSHAPQPDPYGPHGSRSEAEYEQVLRRAAKQSLAHREFALQEKVTPLTRKILEWLDDETSQPEVEANFQSWLHQECGPQTPGAPCPSCTQDDSEVTF